MKKEVFKELLKLMSKCDKCTNFKHKEKSLINIYNDNNWCNLFIYFNNWFNNWPCCK